MSWSSGKDSAWCLHVLNLQPEVEVVGLLTTFNQSANRVAMHGVRRSLVEQQAESLRLPLFPVELDHGALNEKSPEGLTGNVSGVCSKCGEEVKGRTEGNIA